MPLVLLFSTQPALGCTTSWSKTRFGSSAFDSHAIDVLTSTDAWVVGATTTSAGQVAAIRHWDGAAWSSSLAPSIPGTDSSLQLVSAAADDDLWVWANSTLNGGIAAWLAHWDGIAWTVTPDDITPGTSGTAIAAVSPRRAYAVDGHVIARWNGTSWHRLRVPVVGDLNAVVASAPHDVWVLGDRFSCSPCIDRTMTWHWDGSAWTEVPSPNGTSGNIINGAVEISPNDIWAVGTGKRAGGVQGAMTMHWNGATWTMRWPVATAYDSLSSVDAGGPTVWAAGTTWVPDGLGGDWYGRIEHWTPSTGWSLTPDPSPAGTTYYSVGVSAAHGWASGLTSTGDGTTFDALGVTLCPG